jgi:LmbE family N-acetylglucosaminyl deacetylase
MAGDSLAPALRWLFARTLVLEPHCDDETIGCGGLIRKLTAAGCGVYLAVAAVGSTYQPHAGRVVSAMERLQELLDATQVLGVTPERIQVKFNGMDGRLDQLPLAEVVGWLEQQLECTNPTAVLLPYPSHHQDHQVVYRAAMAALRPRTSLRLRLAAMFEYPFFDSWNYAVYRGGKITVDISGQIRAKIEALRAYRSQILLRDRRDPLNISGIIRWASSRGAEIGVGYAESFYPLRMII